MTQGYEPIELTDDMPEPKDEGTYFLFSENISRYLMPIFHDGDYWELADSTCSWSELIGGRNKQERITIQSLAAHDAQIRAEALTLSKSDRMAAYDVFDDKVVLPTDVNPEDAEHFSIDTIIRRIFATVANHRKGQQ